MKLISTWNSIYFEFGATKNLGLFSEKNSKEIEFSMLIIIWLDIVTDIRNQPKNGFKAS